MLARSVPLALRERVRAKLKERREASASDDASDSKPRASEGSPVETHRKGVVLSPVSEHPRAHSRDSSSDIQQMMSPVGFDVLALSATDKELLHGEALPSAGRCRPPITEEPAHGDNDSDAMDDELVRLDTSPMPAMRRPAAHAGFLGGAPDRPLNPLVKLAVPTCANEGRDTEIEPCRSPSPTALFSAAPHLGSVRPRASWHCDSTDEEIVSFDLADTPSAESSEHDSDQAPSGRSCDPVAASLDLAACTLSLSSHRPAELEEGPLPPRVGVLTPIACALSMPSRMSSAPRAEPPHRLHWLAAQSPFRPCGVLASALLVALLLALLVGSDAAADTVAALHPAIGVRRTLRDRRGIAGIGLIAVVSVLRPPAEPTNNLTGATSCESL
jgi:hypothetical protein